MWTAVVVLAAATRMLSLEQALETARHNQPQLMQARANTDVASARAREVRSALLPQVNVTALYQRTTANFVLRPGSVPKSFAGTTTNSFETFNFFNSGLTASQYIWDFGQTTDRVKSAEETRAAARDNEMATMNDVVLNVRTAFFNAVAQKSLRQVAMEALQNQQLHVTQVQGFVTAGTHPAIDLATAQSSLATFQVNQITAQNNYDVARVRLNQAMGLLSVPDYDVPDEWLGPVQGEESAPDALLPEAEKSRPELASLESQINAERLLLSAIHAQYYPGFSGVFSATDGGTNLGNLGWNLGLTINMNWNIFSGYNTTAQEEEARAAQVGLEAQRNTLLQQVLADLTTALLSVKAAKASEQATEMGLTAAREQLRLAQARFMTGLGNAVELSDAQIAVLQAGNLKVQADYALATARAQLLQVLGRQ